MPAAQAGVYNPQPADLSGDPQESFVDDDALFAYSTVDIRGGQICIVNDEVVSPNQGSCDSGFAWGSPNTIVGLGTNYSLIEAPTLHPGTWRLLSVDSKGKPTGLSQAFTVTACRDCSRRLSQEVVAEWKARASAAKRGAEIMCTAWALQEAAEIPGMITAAHGKVGGLRDRADEYQFGGAGFLATVVPTVGGFITFPSVEIAITQGQKKAMEILKNLICTVETMYEDIENDPPDPDFDTVELPSFRPIDSLGAQATDELAESMDRQNAFASASLTAFERYLGADDADSEPGVHRQTGALGEFSLDLTAELRRSARRLRAYSDLLGTLEGFEQPVVPDAERRALLVSHYERVRQHGFAPSELDELEARGFSQAQIDQIREHFELDPADVPIGKTLAELSRDTAAVFDEQAVGFDHMGREAAAVAARTNSPPQVDFEAVPSAGPAPLTVTFTDSSTDADGDDLTVTWQIGGLGQAEGSSVTHTFMFEGLYQVVETVCDRQECSTVTRQIFVGQEPPGNSDPVAADDQATAAIGQPLLIHVLANDSDADSDPLTLSGYTQGAHGDVFCDGFQCSYEPNPGFSGSDSFEYTASDGRGGSDTATVTVTVGAPPNDDPVAAPDFLSVVGTTPGTVDVLKNDSDPNGDRLEVFDPSDPAHGAVDCDPGGACTYTPDQAIDDSDTFTYKVTDGRGGQATTTVQVGLSTGVPPANEPPQADDDSLEIEEGSPGSLDVLDNDSDPDGDELILTGISGNPAGSVTCQASGDCTYTPTAGFSGTDGFDYDVSDGRDGHDGAHVSVIVPAPVASERPVAAFRTVPLGGFAPLSVSFDGSGSTDPDGEVVAWNWDFGDGEQGSGRVAGHTYESAGSYPVKLTVTDSDGAKDSVQFDYQVQSQATLGVPMCGDEDDGTISFGCPEFDLVRDVQLFQVRGSGQVQVEFDFIFREAAFDNELAVVPVDDHAGAIGDLNPGDDGYIRKALERAQVVFPTGSTAFTPDKTLTFEGGQLLMFMIVQGQSVATLLAVNPDNDPSGFVIGFFTLDAINPDVADHVFAFRHESDGRTEFGWEDLAGGGGDFNDIVYTVDEHVRALSALVATAAADEPESVAGTRNGYSVAIANSGPGPTVIQSVELTLPPGFEYVSGSTTGDTASEPSIAGRKLTWNGPFTVDLGERAELHLEVDVAEEVGDYLAEATAAAGGFAITPTGPTAAIKVVRPQRPPVARGDTLATDAGVPAVVDVLANDSDPDSDPLAVSDSTEPSHGSATCTPAGVCTYTPGQGFSGVDSFSYTAADGRGGSSTAGVDVTVKPLPDAGGPGEAGNPNVTDGCVNFQAGVSGGRLGLARLGRTQAEHRAAFQGARLSTRPGTDRYCIAGGGTLRIGYPTPRLERELSARLRRSVKGRAVLLLTTSRRYKLQGVGPGTSVRDLRRRLHPPQRRRIGRNLWYLAPGRGARLLFRTRGERVLEVGVAHAGLTRTTRQVRSFLRAWDLRG